MPLSLYLPPTLPIQRLTAHAAWPTLDSLPASQPSDPPRRKNEERRTRKKIQ